MRPVDKGVAPQAYTNYEDAKQDLTNRLGGYCSYCERRIATGLAVEHILPKDPALGHSHLRNEWTNFLLSCVNCNSAKKTTIINFATYLLPDRDNTFHYLIYKETGLVEVTLGLNATIEPMAQNICDLTALNRVEHDDWDDAVVFSALERAGQRVQAWEKAKDARQDYNNGEVNVRRICSEASATGFFSIWMAAFTGVKEVRLGLIQEFAHTAKDCFDADGNSISPRPANGLLNAGKA
ncbi:HNH endonuclease [Spirosoma sp. KCTC 42546]|uniref:HNH endonuclease n=1 Tax=Spirosoma sp. KCTC 42546 TaxID=2520506 RepID=UPI00115BB2C6|nr:HNH endonuclease [Spirosoma sp. KCTC 42546]QDK81270.1 HNH endonuclease [Spirosoma sp. KCTC 42546]